MQECRHPTVSQIPHRQKNHAAQLSARQPSAMKAFWTQAPVLCKASTCLVWGVDFLYILVVVEGPRKLRMSAAPKLAS